MKQHIVGIVCLGVLAAGCAKTPLQSKPSSRSTLSSTSPMLSPRALSVVPFMVTPPPVHG